MYIEAKCHCERCGYEWIPIRGGIPQTCARCRTPLWNKPRRHPKPPVLVAQERAASDRRAQDSADNQAAEEAAAQFDRDELTNYNVAYAREHPKYLRGVVAQVAEF